MQSKLCISGITALGPKHIRQLWYDGKILPIHSQFKTLKPYAFCKKMLQRNTVFFSHPSLSPDLNRYDLTFYSPSVLGLWTWKLPFFPDMRVNWSHDQIAHWSALGKLLRFLPSNLPLLCQTADACAGLCLAHTAAHLQKAKLMPLEHQFHQLYMVLFKLMQLQLDMKGLFSWICPQCLWNQKCSTHYLLLMSSVLKW